MIKTGSQIKMNVNGYSCKYGTLMPKPKSMFLDISGYYKFDDYPENFEANYKRFNAIIKKFWYNLSNDRLKDLRIDPKMFVCEFDARTTGYKLGVEMGFFRVSIDLFFDSIIIVKKNKLLQSRIEKLFNEFERWLASKDVMIIQPNKE